MDRQRQTPARGLAALALTAGLLLAASCSAEDEATGDTAPTADQAAAATTTSTDIDGDGDTASGDGAASADDDPAPGEDSEAAAAGPDPAGTDPDGTSTQDGDGGAGSGAEADDGPVVRLDEVVEIGPPPTDYSRANAVLRGERDRFTLEVSAAQVLDIAASAEEDNVAFDLLGADGTVLVAEATTARIEVLDADLPAVYEVLVGGTRGNASYQLTVTSG